MIDAGSAIRPVRPEDVPAVVAMVHELAGFERSAGECRLTDDALHTALFATRPALFGLVAAGPDEEPVGFALWYVSYSTWTGTHGVYLEDLFVAPAHRGSGLGRQLMAELARICQQRGYHRLEWGVLDWNVHALRFYRALGAQPLPDWTRLRLDGDALADLALPTAGVEALES